MIILGIDPGESNGLARISFDPHTKEVQPVEVRTLKRLDFYKYLSTKLTNVEILVVEDFRVRPGMARSGAFDQDRMVACQVIGACEMIATTTGRQFVLQPPSVKPAAYGWTGYPYQRNSRNRHHLDALAHGVYYLVTRHSAKPPSSLSPADLSLKTS